uniref:Uncharacterized protein n=1 Tax=Rhizophora mucronata TaxID=61149 RepID=A0A2P2QXU1_RHIMU
MYAVIENLYHYTKAPTKLEKLQKEGKNVNFQLRVRDRNKIQHLIFLKSIFPFLF